MSTKRELAFRYDLFITPDWRDRFDSLVNQKIALPQEGRILEINCGTGAHSIEIAIRMKEGKGEVVAIDPSRERIELAEAKAQAKKVKNLRFECCDWRQMPFSEGEFDAVIGDASMESTRDIAEMLDQMVEVTRGGGLVVLKLTTRGSFDEFFSIYWEALFDCGLADQLWSELEALIRERMTVSEAEQLAGQAGLESVESFCKKEEFLYETGRAFLESPLIKDSFLEGWLSIVPKSDRQRVRRQIASVIERERHGAPFDLSIKATLIAGTKRQQAT
jgi:ubiquinone/menaquinone biosynthesis C-methylase UbiE